MPPDSVACNGFTGPDFKGILKGKTNAPLQQHAAKAKQAANKAQNLSKKSKDSKKNHHAK